MSGLVRFCLCSFPPYLCHLDRWSTVNDDCTTYTEPVYGVDTWHSDSYSGYGSKGRLLLQHNMCDRGDSGVTICIDPITLQNFEYTAWETKNASIISSRFVENVGHNYLFAAYGTTNASEVQHGISRRTLWSDCSPNSNLLQWYACEASSGLWLLSVQDVENGSILISLFSAQFHFLVAIEGSMLPYCLTSNSTHPHSLMIM
ncbi:hypothetical protein V1514DRAFT_342573 [Lipomyces japonicus]|uniref:uncharacterized protein n=1 Tax=Lipomyces japonicus TaxID=56871 RepID=UPI0034CF90FF